MVFALIAVSREQRQKEASAVIQIEADSDLNQVVAGEM